MEASSDPLSPGAMAQVAERLGCPLGRRHLLRDAWAIARPYWGSKERWAAWELLLVVALTLGIVSLNVLLNPWHNTFYNALQDGDSAVFVHQFLRGWHRRSRCPYLCAYYAIHARRQAPTALARELPFLLNLRERAATGGQTLKRPIRGSVAQVYFEAYV
jgi:hypothetical protein